VKLTEMTPLQHVQRAEVLMQRLDDRYDEEGKLKSTNGAGWTITPVQLTLADLHMRMAVLKADPDFR
jgi:hypothetical protein